MAMAKRHKHEKLPLTYAHEGDDSFVVKYDPKIIEVIQREGEVRFVSSKSMLRIEII
jgi:hypothetical protein